MLLSPSFALALLLQTAAATPATAPTATPTPGPELGVAPTPTPVSRSVLQPRTLQDVARERRLKAGSGLKSTPNVMTVGTSTPTAGGKPGAAPSASPAPGENPQETAPTAADVRVVSVSNDGIVDATGGVRVTGTIRNAGDQPVCGVVISVKILDAKGAYLSSAQAAPDVSVLASGETTSFHTVVQAPPGVRGGRVNPDRRDVTDGSTTMAGDWKLLGGADAKVVDANACAK